MTRSRWLAMAVMPLVVACGSDDALLPPIESDPPPTVEPAPETTDTEMVETETPETTAPETTPPDTAPETSTVETTTTVEDTPTTTPAGPSTDVAAFLMGGDGDVPLLPLGWWDGSRFRSADDDFPDVDGRTASLVSIQDVPSTGSMFLPVGDEFAAEACFDGRTGFGVDRTLPVPDPPGFGYSTVAVVAPWEAAPRPVAAIGLEVEEYRQIGARLADGLGVDGNRGEVIQVLRVDLDGNGIEEVLVTYEYVQPSILGAPGDFSLVYLRSPDATGEVTDSIVASWTVDPDISDDEIPYMLWSRVQAVADLDGDGTMEVVVHRWYYEGASMEAHQVTDGTTQVVAQNGCGA